MTQLRAPQLPPRTPSIKAACHSGAASGSAGVGAPVVALAGAPNSGKSTLFNGLTGSRVTMGNWPGTTVEVSTGAWRIPGGSCSCGDCQGDCHCGWPAEVTLVDLPGAYSLDPESPDEALTRELLVEGPEDERPDLTVVLVDANRLSHCLYLVSQLRERGQRVVVALTMVDVAARRGVEIHLPALQRHLGCPVIALDPRRRGGLERLAAVVRSRLATEPPPPRPVAGAEDQLAIDDERFGWIAEAVEASVTRRGGVQASLSDRVDRWATAPVIGPLLFLAVMWLVFQVTTTVAAPMQDLLDRLVSGPVTEAAVAALAWAGLGGSWVEGLVVDGLIAGVGSVLTFVPLMLLMFVLLALLEDSGYLARAAVVTDRLMRAIGLPGRAFLPLIVGYGCNVPAMAATRILPSARQRVLTTLLVPFTNCPARLTVFAMMASIFFPDSAGTVIFAMYLISVLIIVGVGLGLRATLWRGEALEPLVIDLPAYQAPTLRLTATVTWVRLKGFLQTAGGIIVATVAVVWLLQSLPTQPGVAFGETSAKDSVYGVGAQAIAPVFAPAGFGNWQTSSTLVVGFVAKEAVISSWAQTYALDEPENVESPGDLGSAVLRDFTESSGGHPGPAALAFMVFLMSYSPCVATLAAQWREVGGRWTMFGVALQLVTAWVLAVGIFQIGRLWW